MVLCVKADSPEVYIGLWHSNQEVVFKSWEAGRELSVQILSEIKSLCKKAQIDLQNLDGIVAYEGPGSYTGLRISVSVVNALGYAHAIPVVGSTGTTWVMQGLQELGNVHGFRPISPVYGGEVYTTKPKK
jgi:tRNA threonylcarbamoyladenosine biosynthesis protein TsaB